MTAKDFVLIECKDKVITALDLNKLLYEAGISCSAPAQLLDDLYRNAEIELAGHNPGPQKAYRIRSRWAELGG